MGNGLDDKVHADETPYVIPAKPGVKVHDTQYGMIAVRNFNDPNRTDVEEESLFVLIHPNDAEKVAKWILEVADAIRRSFPADVEPGMQPEDRVIY
jgi:hypothetical protein